MMRTLAIHGGKPARDVPLPPNYPGAVVFGEEEREAAGAVAQSRSPFRYYGPDMQDSVRRFEERMAETLGVPFALAVSSGTAALIVALKSLGVGYGDKVIVPANTFVATAGAVVCCNAVPVFADVDDSLNLDPDDLVRVIDDEVKAIVTVPILGNPCDMDPIMEVSRKYGIPVVEDVAQSCGATYRGAYVGTIGQLGTLSFQMNKTITSGEGGAVVTRDAVAFERAVRYHDQGLFREKERYGLGMPDDLNESFYGQNYRMSEFAGAVMIEQWRKLNDIASRMRQSYAYVKEALLDAVPYAALRREPDPAGSLGSNLGFILPSAAVAGHVVDALAAERIAATVLYGGKPIYAIPHVFERRTAERNGFPFDYPFRSPVVYTPGMCPRAEDLLPRTVYVPISPLLNEADVESIVEGLVSVYMQLVPKP